MFLTVHTAVFKHVRLSLDNKRILSYLQQDTNTRSNSSHCVVQQYFTSWRSAERWHLVCLYHTVCSTVIRMTCTETKFWVELSVTFHLLARF